MTTPGELFASASLILLDFDGPVTRLLPPPANRVVAEDVRRFAKEQGVPLTDEEEATTDHLAIIRAASRTAAACAVEAHATRAETEAAHRSPITPGIRALLESTRNNGSDVVIVTNNSPECVTTFLATHHLMSYISAVVGRDPDNIDRMKPHPFILEEGMRRSHRRPAVMIGDSVSDVFAALAAAVPVIGIAKNDERDAELRAAGSTATARHLSELMPPS